MPTRNVVLTDHQAELIERLRQLGAQSVRPLEGAAEHVVFTLPREVARPDRR